MSLLSDGEITAMRDTADSILPGTVVIQRASAAADGHGGMVPTWSNYATCVCRLDVRDREITTMTEGAINGALNVVARYTMYFKHDQDITEKDRVVFGGITYEVTAVMGEQSWTIAKRAELARLKP
jgi:head-tail adaptor